jgi:hypothetical protein
MYESDKIRDVETNIYMSRESEEEKEKNVIQEYLDLINEYDLSNLYDLLDGLIDELNDKGAGVPYYFDKFFGLIDELKETAEEWK